jgi:hypothetical protein
MSMGSSILCFCSGVSESGAQESGVVERGLRIGVVGDLDPQIPERCPAGEIVKVCG